MNQEDLCGICLETLSSKKKQWLQCSHVFHEACLLQMRRLNVAGLCPTCRHASQDLTPLHELCSKAIHHDISKRWSKSCFYASEAVEIALESSEEAISMHRLLGVRFLEGKGVKQNICAGMQHLQKACLQHDSHACIYLGELYCFACIGDTNLNITKALELFEQARSQGSAQASCHMSILYILDIGIEKNIERSFELMEEAQKNGHEEASHIIANFHTHYDNHGMEIAIELFEAAVKDLADVYQHNCLVVYENKTEMQ